MLKKFFFVAIALLSSCPCQAAILHSWNTVGNLGTETIEASIFDASGLATSNLTLGAGITAAANGNRFGGSGWFDAGNTAAGNTLSEAIAGNSYIQFVVTPNAGTSFSATSLDFIWDRSGTGPSAVTLRSSFDSFASDLGTLTDLVSGGAATTTARTISISGLSNISTAITFRLYGTGATAAGGTGGFDTATGAAAPNVVFNGSITAVPEPTSIALVAMIGTVGLTFAIRRRKVASQTSQQA